MKTVTHEAILPDNNWLNGYQIDIEVEFEMTGAARAANERQQASMDGESRFVQAFAGQSRLKKGQYNSNWHATYMEIVYPRRIWRACMRFWLRVRTS